MKKLILIGALIVSVSNASIALAEDLAILKVSGVVCSFCAQGIRKSFEKTETVKTVDVNLDKHEVTLAFIPGKDLSDKEISNVLESSGYNLLEVTRSNGNENTGGNVK